MADSTYQNEIEEIEQDFFDVTMTAALFLHKNGLKLGHVRQMLEGKLDFVFSVYPKVSKDFDRYARKFKKRDFKNDHSHKNKWA